MILLSFAFDTTKTTNRVPVTPSVRVKTRLFRWKTISGIKSSHVVYCDNTVLSTPDLVARYDSLLTQ